MSQIKVQIAEDLNTHLTAYLDLGLPIIPIVPPSYKGMSLTMREKYSENQLGKIPLIAGWRERETTSYDEVNDWLSKWKYVNFGLPMGNASGLVGVDIDGDLGEQLLHEWSKGDLPATWSFSTKAGRRILYAVPEGVIVKKYREASGDKVHEELALMGEGQQTVVPPSVHPSGAVYTWDEGFSPWDIPMPAMAPQWVLDRMCTDNREAASKENYSKQVTQDEWKTELIEGNRSQQLTRLAGSLTARGNLPKDFILDSVRTWNQKNCKPPLADEELVRMVEYVWLSEQEAQKNKPKSRRKLDEEFIPNELAEKIQQAELKKGFHWKFLEDKGIFYFYDEAEGYWKHIRTAYVQERIRKYLYATEKTWATKAKTAEVLEALQMLLQNEEDVKNFDISKQTHELLNVQNGMLDPYTGEITPHRPDFNSFIQFPVDWDETADCPNWEKYMRQWIPNEETIQFLQEYMGYCLTTDTSYRTAVFLMGGGRNGKSVFLHGMSELFGEIAKSRLTLHAMAEKFSTAEIMNKLVNICDELSSEQLEKTGILKAIISGDPIKAEFKFGASFNFTPVAKLIFSTNVLPRAKDRSEGWYSRLRIVNFPNQFKPNKKSKETMYKNIQKELPGIFTWAVEGLRRLQEKGEFTQSEEMLDALDEYKADNDSAAAFSRECLVLSDTGKPIPTKEVYQFYVAYCKDNGLRPTAQKEFVTRVKADNVVKTQARSIPDPHTGKRRSVNCFLNIKIGDAYTQEFNMARVLTEYA